MGQVLASAVLHQQMPANEIRQTRAVLKAIVSGHRAAGLKFGPSEEIANLFERSPVLKRDRCQASNYVIEGDQLRGAVRTFEAEKHLSGVFVVMNADVERAARNPDFLRDVPTTKWK